MGDPLLKVGLQPKGAKAQAKRLARSHAWALKERDREKLRQLRARLKAARLRKQAAMTRAVESCRRARRNVAARIKAYRASERERINREVGELRQAARNRCQARKARIRASGSDLIAKRERAVREEARYQRELQRFSERAKKKRKRNTGRERAQESDQAVRSNLPPELRPVFDRVRKRIKGGPRRTRTEAFLEWAQENPEDVIKLQGDEADREVARLVREHDRLLARLETAKAYEVSPEDLDTLERMGLAPTKREAKKLGRGLAWRDEVPF